MRRSFSVEDLLDEVEKICYHASGTSKVRNYPHQILRATSLEMGTLQSCQRRTSLFISVFCAVTLYKYKQECMIECIHIQYVQGNSFMLWWPS